MKFRTEITPRPLPRPIEYEEGLLMLGSCFADEMRQWLTSLKFHASGNFAGPLFNPESIAAAIETALSEQRLSPCDLHCSAEGRYFSYDTATAFDDTDAEAVAARCNEATRHLREALGEARHLFLTFGTAWVYRLRTTGKVVANCHKQPQTLFKRERLTVEEIVTRWSALLEGPLREMQVILTVSPIRHLGDGLEGNAVSKALLRLAAETLAERFEQVHYFPAYELLTDDLRDYRYYADDLCHPSTQAIHYIRERFAEAAFTEQTLRRMAEVEKLLLCCAHRPHDDRTEAYRQMCRATIERMRATNLDFSAEIALLEARL